MPRPGQSVLSAEDLDRLVKLCGMLGSAHAGERAAAAAKADEFVKRHGLTWGDVLSPPGLQVDPPSCAWTEPASDRDAALACLRWPEVLTAWEVRYLRSIASLPALSERQQDVLDGIVEKVRAFAAMGEDQAA